MCRHCSTPCRDRVVQALYDTEWLRERPRCHICSLLTFDVTLTIVIVLLIILLVAVVYFFLVVLGLGWVVLIYPARWYYTGNVFGIAFISGLGTLMALIVACGLLGIGLHSCIAIITRSGYTSPANQRHTKVADWKDSSCSDADVILDEQEPVVVKV
jgi:hypothetical protein